MKLRIKIIAAFVGLGLLFFFSTVQFVDDTPLIDSSFFHKTQQRLDSQGQIERGFNGDTLGVGWAKVNLTPPFKTSLAGYGVGEFETIKDSVWIRVFLFDNGNQRIALLAPDLLIFPPIVKANIESHREELNLDAIYYSATHTHHSIGNWHPNLVGRMFAGQFNPTVVEWMGDQFLKAIKSAQQNLKQSKVGFAAVQADHLVYNRLVKEMGTIDPWMRFMIFEQDSGKTAILSSFAAHATNISRDQATIHRDYPGMLVDLLEESPDIDFAAFMAGAVASQGPKGHGYGEEKAAFIAADLREQIELISNVVQPQYTSVLAYEDFTLDLREPHFRISENLRLKPWVFDQFFGDYSSSLTFLRIGDTLLVGTPCDFSGELVAPIESSLRKRNVNLMITSFNGDYVGYITKDDWYNLDNYETRTMNWFGAENGKYFSQMILGIADLMIEDNNE